MCSTCVCDSFVLALLTPLWRDCVRGIAPLPPMFFVMFYVCIIRFCVFVIIMAWDCLLSGSPQSQREDYDKTGSQPFAGSMSKVSTGSQLFAGSMSKVSTGSQLFAGI